MITGKAAFEVILKDNSYEFPVINQKYMGYKTRYTYIAYLWSEMPEE